MVTALNKYKQYYLNTTLCRHDDVANVVGDDQPRLARNRERRKSANFKQIFFDF